MSSDERTLPARRLVPFCILPQELQWVVPHFLQVAQLLPVWQKGH